MEALIKAISDGSLSIVINALFLYVVYHYYKQLGPKLDTLTAETKSKNHSQEELSKIVEAYNKVLSEVAKSNDNIAKSLTVLNATMEGHKELYAVSQELVKLVHEDTKETQARLYIHDDKSEKIYTMLHKMYVDKYGRIDL